MVYVSFDRAHSGKYTSNWIKCLKAYVEFTQSKIDDFYLNFPLLLKILTQSSHDLIIVVEGTFSIYMDSKSVHLDAIRAKSHNLNEEWWQKFSGGINRKIKTTVTNHLKLARRRFGACKLIDVSLVCLQQSHFAISIDVTFFWEFADGIVEMCWCEL